MLFLLEGGGVRSPGAGATANGLSSTDNIWFRRAFALSWNTVQHCFYSKLQQVCKWCTPWWSTHTLKWHCFLWGHMVSWCMCECDFIDIDKKDMAFPVLYELERLTNTMRSLTLKADSHIACLAHAVPLLCRAAKGLECVFPIWFKQCGHVWFTLAMPCPCCAHAMLWPRCSSQGHGTARPSRDSLWATCPRSASSSYHAEYHEDCYQEHTNPPHNNPYIRL